MNHIKNLRPFHLAFPVLDLEEARDFYMNTLGCSIGRESDQWIDFNLYGHQIVAHLSPNEIKDVNRSQVDGDAVPVRHFGVILENNEWQKLVDRLKTKGEDFLIEPRVRFEGKSGEQRTLFILDPSGNALEFKSFAHDGHIFRR
ncbi:MAG: glyoxalase [Candidatus Neomarinimicrobiota bacterium]|jgi:extradiol dioxygenase family protein|nr:MAG: glyoxalase [Candidatus Neomarinimicrobiota bacterium]